MIPPLKPYEIGRTIEASRGFQTDRSNDTFKIPKISIYDVDYAMLWHMQEQLRIKVEDNGNLIDVPVIYAAGEKWAQIQKYGHLRDNKNRIMRPLLSIRRTEVAVDDRLPQKNLNARRLTIKAFPTDKQAGQDGLDGMEFYIIDVPRFIRVTYNVSVWAQTTEQLNSIIQTVQYADNHVWGDFYKFRTQVLAISNTIESGVGVDRIVKADFSLLVDAYLREEYEYHEPSVVKAFTITKVQVAYETEPVTQTTRLPSNPVEAYLFSELRTPRSKTSRLR